MAFSISVVNASTVVSDAEGAAVIAAIQTQVTRDFFPVWGMGATLTFFPKGHAVPANTWQMAILDNSDQAGALGYHDITSTGQPLGKIFAKSDQQYGLQWSVTASHEVLEMILDPWVNITVFDQSTDTAGRMYAYEVCDACEDDKYGYLIGKILVSDFVFPAWFEGWRKYGSTRFDFGGHIQSPFALLSGGYISYFDVKNSLGWQMKSADDEPSMKTRAPVGSRRERRTAGPNTWVTSTV